MLSGSIVAALAAAAAGLVQGSPLQPRQASSVISSISSGASSVVSSATSGAGELQSKALLS